MGIKCMCPVCAAPEKECGWTIGKFQKEKGDATMKSNKRMQALLSTAMCAAILFSNAAALRIDYKYIHNVAVSSFLKVSSSLLIYILLHLFTTLLSHF